MKGLSNSQIALLKQRKTEITGDIVVYDVDESTELYRYSFNKSHEFNVFVVLKIGELEEAVGTQQTGIDFEISALDENITNFWNKSRGHRVQIMIDIGSSQVSAFDGIVDFVKNKDGKQPTLSIQCESVNIIIKKNINKTLSDLAKQLSKDGDNSFEYYTDNPGDLMYFD